MKMSGYINKFSQYINESKDEDNPNYMLGNVKYSWVKSVIKTVLRMEPNNITRIEILSNRKKELRLPEFQTLYEYWNFCDKNSGDFNIANTPVENYKRVIRDWTWYLAMIQLFPGELENAKRDFYTRQYQEIKSLPELTGDLDSDKNIFENAVRKFFMAPEGIVRQSMLLYDILIKNLF